MHRKACSHLGKGLRKLIASQEVKETKDRTGRQGLSDQFNNPREGVSKGQRTERGVLASKRPQGEA